jgi:hypothetical protein
LGLNAKIGMSTTASSTKPRSRKGKSYRWLVAGFALVYFISLAIIFSVSAIVPALGWGVARTFRIVGLSFNIIGAFTSLAPRASRTVEDIERELAMTEGRERLRRDTVIARWGIVIFGVGFIQQLIGNLIG